MHRRKPTLAHGIFEPHRGDYVDRLDSLSRAFEAGCDDMGVGARLGLYDGRVEILGLVTHARHLRARHDVGPHTIGFPRLRPATGVDLDLDPARRLATRSSSGLA